MSTAPTPSSQWIESIAYHDGFLALFLHYDDIDDTVALLYGPVPQGLSGICKPIPPWLPGLLKAGTGKRSVGLAYNRLVKGQYAYQRVEGVEKVNELRRLMTCPS